MKRTGDGNTVTGTVDLSVLDTLGPSQALLTLFCHFVGQGSRNCIIRIYSINIKEPVTHIGIGLALLALFCHFIGGAQGIASYKYGGKVGITRLIGIRQDCLDY